MILILAQSIIELHILPGSYKTLGAEKIKLDNKKSMKYNHVGIPTKKRFDGEIDLPELMQ